MLVHDIRNKSECFRQAALSLAGLQDRSSTVTRGAIIKRGDVLEFYGGYNNDIRFRAEVAGVIGEDVYLIWDCYWSPIKDDNKRKIVKIVDTD